MFFQIYGETAGWQLLGWLLVFAGLVVMNEIARRSKAGGIACFLFLQHLACTLSLSMSEQQWEPIGH